MILAAKDAVVDMLREGTDAHGPDPKAKVRQKTPETLFAAADVLASCAYSLSRLCIRVPSCAKQDQYPIVRDTLIT